MAPPQQGTFKLVPAPGVLLVDLGSRKGVPVAPFADRDRSWRSGAWPRRSNQKGCHHDDEEKKKKRVVTAYLLAGVTSPGIPRPAQSSGRARREERRAGAPIGHAWVGIRRRHLSCILPRPQASIK
jgi:hypothetical protein